MNNVFDDELLRELQTIYFSSETLICKKKLENKTLFGFCHRMGSFQLNYKIRLIEKDALSLLFHICRMPGRDNCFHGVLLLCHGRGEASDRFSSDSRIGRKVFVMICRMSMANQFSKR